MYKAIFFDLDEVIIDAMDCHHKANKKAFVHFGINYDEIKKKTQGQDFLGKRMNDILQIMRDAVGISEKQLPLKQLTKTREDYFLELVKQNSKLLPGAKEALLLVKGKHKTVAITSSGTKKYITLILEQFDLKKFVDFIVGEEDVERGKPFPDCYEKAYSLLPDKSITKKECLVIEDSINGVKAAQAARLPVCFVPQFPYKEKITPDFQLKSLEEFSTLPL